MDPDYPLGRFIPRLILIVVSYGLLFVSRIIFGEFVKTEWIQYVYYALTVYLLGVITSQIVLRDELKNKKENHERGEK